MRTLLACLFALSLACAPAMAASRTVASSGSLTALGFADTSNISVGQSLSAMFSINQNWLQTFLTITQTKDAFTFGLGGIYKFTVAGDRHMGFHVGPGFAVGTVPASSVAGATSGTSKTKFAFSIYGLAGAHYTIFDRLILSVDGGPMVNVIDGTADFSMKPMGQLLGLGLHYLF
jgi:hypothetical protein